MKAVETLQQTFQEAVLSSDLLPGLFVGEERQDGGGMDIYINAYRGRLISALKDNYPILHLALGDESFNELALKYLERHPSRHRSIRWFGDRLRDFLDDCPESIPHPALADLASMDWALRRAFDAGEATPYSETELGKLAPDEWPGLRFHLHPSVTLLNLDWQIEPIWHALSQNPDAETEAPEAQEHALLVWRRELECLWRSADAKEAAALQTLVAGKSFADVCATLADQGGEHLAESDAALRAASLLRQWINDGLLVQQVEEQ